MCPLTVVWLAGFGAGAWFGVSALALPNRERLACTRRVGWLPCSWRWVGWLTCVLFGGESGDGFLVFGCGGYRCTPGWDVAHPGVQPEHVAPACGAFGVIVVNAVVVGAEEGEVFEVGKTSCLPGDEVVDFAVISGFVAAGPRAGLEFSCQADALFPAGMPLNPIRVNRAFKGVDDGGVANLGKLVGQKVCAGHARAVGEFKFDFLPITVDNAVKFIQGDNDLSMYGRFSANTTGDNDGAGSIKQVCFINGF